MASSPCPWIRTGLSLGRPAAGKLAAIGHGHPRGPKTAGSRPDGAYRLRRMQEVDGFDRRSLDEARISRDPRFDGRFFIAVRTTGIYCRPICPAPRCKSRNVRYYPTAAAAASAGYRPCLRCRPEAAPGTPAWIGTSAVVRRALRLIHEGALNESGVDELALRVGVGPRHLHRLFLQHVGASPIAVAQTRRLHFAKRLLDDSAAPDDAGGARRGLREPAPIQLHVPADLRQVAARAAQAAAKRRDPVADGEILLKLSYRPPYDWEQVSGFLAREACAGVERVDASGYARTVETVDGAVDRSTSLRRPASMRSCCACAARHRLRSSRSRRPCAALSTWGRPVGDRRRASFRSAARGPRAPSPGPAHSGRLGSVRVRGTHDTLAERWRRRLRGRSRPRRGALRQAGRRRPARADAPLSAGRRTLARARNSKALGLSASPGRVAARAARVRRRRPHRFLRAGGRRAPRARGTARASARRWPSTWPCGHWPSPMRCRARTSR